MCGETFSRSCIPTGRVCLLDLYETVHYMIRWTMLPFWQRCYKNLSGGSVMCIRLPPRLLVMWIGLPPIWTLAKKVWTVSPKKIRFQTKSNLDQIHLQSECSQITSIKLFSLFPAPYRSLFLSCRLSWMILLTNSSSPPSAMISVTPPVFTELGGGRREFLELTPWWRATRQTRITAKSY